jgi:hypothetical protein
MRSLYGASSLVTVSKYQLDLVAVQEVRWEGVALNWQENTHFSTEKEKRLINQVQGFLCIRESSAVNRAEFVSDRMSYIILRSRWCHIIVLNVHAPTEDKTDDVKGSFYEELEHVFDKFPKYHMKILLGDFSAKVSKERHF